MKEISVGVVVGSARTGSYSKTVAQAIIGLLPPEIQASFLTIADLPIYNQDYDAGGNIPPEYTRFRQEVAARDAYLFVTPEHNRSIPALLKNALDVASRPMGNNVWSGKPGAVVSVSPSGIGGFGANHIVRQSMAFLNIFMMQQPEAYIGGVTDMIDADGAITSERSVGFLTLVAESYAAWVQRFQK